MSYAVLKASDKFSNRMTFFNANFILRSSGSLGPDRVSVFSRRIVYRLLKPGHALLTLPVGRCLVSRVVVALALSTVLASAHALEVFLPKSIT